MSQIENRLKALGFTLPPPFPVPETMQSYMSMAHIIGHRCIISGHAALNPGEAAEHPHIKHRQIYQTIEGNIEAAPAPRFKSQSPKTSRKNSVPTNVNQILKEWGHA